MKTILKDLLTVEEGIIIDQRNCQAVMGSGIAKAIREKWPKVYTEYLQFCRNFGPAKYLLGRIQTCELVEGKLFSCGLFGQFNYGTDLVRYTSYGAWEKALPEIKHLCRYYNLTPYFPYNCGCDRGRGDWEIISRLIYETLPEAVICKI